MNPKRAAHRISGKQMSSGAFHADRMESIFPENEWRDPSDDIERLAYYILFAAGGLAGLAGIIASIYTLVHFNPPAAGVDIVPRELLWVCVGLGSLITAFCAVFLFKEARTWNLRKLNAERAISGLFCFFIALLVICLWMAMEGVGGIVILAYGAPVVLSGIVLCYVLGLVAAYFPRWFPKVQIFDAIYVTGRYAMDEKAMEHDDYVTPYEDGMTGFVVLRQSQGGEKHFKASRFAYECCRSGTVGRAKIVNGVIKEFRVISVRKIAQ